jgi:hypothetical protein
MIRLILAALAFVSVALPAQARQHHHHHRHHVITRDACEGLFCENNPFSGARSISVTMHLVRHRHLAIPLPRPRPMAANEIVAHPSGCPRVAYCGCGAAVRIFGHSVRELWLAANWFRFPRTAPAPGMAAVRRHHVMVLEADLGGGIWQVFDANSGHHLTRLHARSIAGYQIVNPHGVST